MVDLQPSASDNILDLLDEELSKLESKMSFVIEPCGAASNTETDSQDKSHHALNTTNYQAPSHLSDEEFESEDSDLSDEESESEDASSFPIEWPDIDSTIFGTESEPRSPLEPNPTSASCQTHEELIATSASFQTHQESPSPIAEHTAANQLTFDVPEMPTHMDITLMEQAVTSSHDTLITLKMVMIEQGAGVKSAPKWLESIDDVLLHNVKPKTIIGIIGGTGSGKSSILNSLLEEEQIVPTNSMRACTAVVTEVSYNESLGAAYRAEIEFISVAEWKTELGFLHDDLLGSNGTLSTYARGQHDSEEGIAYAKIKAVYPELTNEAISQTSVADLLNHQNCSFLGTTQVIEDSNKVTFYKSVQRFVDSKEKDKSKTASKPREPSLWPLIRVVRIFTKSSIFEKNGAVLVDLPGVQDSNMARAHVAEKYMQQCSALWVVAPITRAVNDKTAKDLLGKSFKRQLHMDGSLKNLTFVCSKTDDNNIMESANSLTLPPDFTRLQEEAEDYQEALSTYQLQLNKTRALKRAMENKSKKLLELQKFEKKALAGKPVSVQRKRKRGEDSNVQLLPLAKIQSDIADLQQLLKPQASIEKDIERVEHDIENLKKEINTVQAEQRILCTIARNDYARAEIRRDFAAGIRQLDQDFYQGQDENFNPEIDVRNYEEIERELAVFTVSSRAYQKLRGRFRREAAVQGFMTLEQTEIPQLQEHCKDLTIGPRDAASRAYWASMCQLLNSMWIWATATETEDDGIQRLDLHERIEYQLGQVKLNMTAFVASSCKKLASMFELEIIRHLGELNAK